MNQQRRKEIARILVDVQKTQELLVTATSEVRQTIEAALESVKDRMDTLLGSVSLDDLVSDIESVMEEEQEYFDNMPEGFQNGERGQIAHKAMSQLESAHEIMDGVREFLTDFTFDDLVEKLDELEGLEDRIDAVTSALEEAAA